MHPLESVQHLSIQELEQAFRLLWNQYPSEPLPQSLVELSPEQWMSVESLLHHLQQEQVRSSVH